MVVGKCLRGGQVMWRPSRYFVAIAVLTVTVLGSGWSGRQSPTEKMAASAPSAGARAEFLQEINYYEQRYTRLAEAVPADKYAWRPAEGVRSIGEVYAHIAAANYGVARALGTQPPPGFDFKA